MRCSAFWGSCLGSVALARLTTLARLALLSRLIVVAASLTMAGFASGQNWPSFRGPGATGVGTGAPPATWDVKTGKNIRWKTPIPVLGHSSPIVWGDRVFVTTAVSSDADPQLKVGLYGDGDSAKESASYSWRVYCVDAGSGKIVWEREACKGTPKMKRHTKATQANSTPATDGKHVLAFFGSEGLYCYDMEGKPLWNVDFGVLQSAPHDAPELQWGFASSPVIHGDTVVVQCDAANGSFVAALNVDTGKELWRKARDEGATWGTPTVCTAGGRAQVVCNGWKHMGGYDLRTGEELWKMSGGGDVPVPTPFVAHDLIYIANGHGAMKPIYAIRPEAKGDITPGEDDKSNSGIAWWNRGRGSYIPTPIVYEDILYIGDDRGSLTTYDARTGEQHYRLRLSDSQTAAYSASAVAAGGHVYFTSEEGDIRVVKAGPKYELLATNAMDEICMATPAISHGRLFVRTKGNLYCIAE